MVSDWQCIAMLACPDLLSAYVEYLYVSSIHVLVETSWSSSSRTHDLAKQFQVAVVAVCVFCPVDDSSSKLEVGLKALPCRWQFTSKHHWHGSDHHSFFNLELPGRLESCHDDDLVQQVIIVAGDIPVSTRGSFYLSATAGRLQPGQTIDVTVTYAPNQVGKLLSAFYISRRYIVGCFYICCVVSVAYGLVMQCLHDKLLP